MIFEADLPKVKAAWADAVAGCGSYQVEYRVHRADRGTAHVVEHGQASRQALQGVVLRGILVDVTTQREAEASVKDMHRMMVEASRQAGMAEIATGVLHNVGNVLNSLNVGAKLLLERLERSLHLTFLLCLLLLGGQGGLCLEEHACGVAAQQRAEQQHEDHDGWNDALEPPRAAKGGTT